MVAALNNRRNRLEDEGIKSALEIAMERIARMPELTPDEITAQKEKEYAPIGLALSKRFLDGTILESELAPEMKKYSGEQGRIVRRVLIDALCRSIQLDDKQRSRKALSGIGELLSPEDRFPQSAGQDLENILAGYDEEKAKEARRLEGLEIERLIEFGISGTAVRPNVVENEAWQRGIQRIKQAFEPRLESIRKALYTGTDEAKFQK
jgi:hypothetical protein